ncbi:hypothetical protein JVU11DRAFT_11005 [Chiua virens]|nr:hypothetical protein JVU11DRAFT_11005 [Chiua virens]
MSPIPSAATAVPATPSISPEPVPAGQSASAIPYQLRTGSLIFCAVAIISVASYFYHRRRTTDSARTTTARTPFSGFLSSRRHRSSDVVPAAATADRTAEFNPEQHVSMIYARFFHPTFWNLVECHPPTPSAPAIYVEDEATEIPVPEPIPYGMTSFLDVDDEDEDEDNIPKRACEKRKRGTSYQVVQLPPYDASSPTNVNFSSEIIGVTVRSGAYLVVPSELEDDLLEDASDSKPDVSCSTDVHSLATSPTSSPGIQEPDVACHPEVDAPLSVCDAVSTTSSTSPSHNRRYGLADMTNLTQRLQDKIPKAADTLGPTISLPTTHNATESVTMAPSTSERSLDSPESLDDASTHAHCNLDLQTRDAPHEGVALMQRLLEALRDPDLESPRRALSDTESESEYETDEESDPRHIATRSSSSDLDVGPISPVTPSSGDASMTSTTTKSYVHHLRKFLAPGWFNEHVQAKGHGRTRRDRALRLAPWVA